MARRLSRYNDAIRQHAVVDAWDTMTNTLAPLSYLEYITYGPFAAATFAASTNYPIYTAANDGKTWQVVGASARFTTAAGGAATFQLETAGAAVAPGSGVNQLSAGVALNGTANTTVNATTIATPTVFGAGTSLNIVVGSTATTSLVGLVINVVLQRVT